MGKKHKLKRKIKVFNKLRPYKYLSPALISISILSLLPIVYTIYIAFTNYSLNHLEDFHFVGLNNFKSIFTGSFKSVFFPVLSWTFVYSFVATFVCFAFALGLAILLNNPNMKESSFYKGVLILPWALPATIATLAWQGLFDKQYGGINVLLNSLHIINQNIPWLTDGNWARIGMLIVTLWLGYPYMMNICIGALTTIPDAYYEAAEIDGASSWQKFRKITLPSLTTASLPLLISSFAFNFNNMSAAYLITSGGPAKVASPYAGYTDVIMSAVYKMSIINNRYDIASALSIIVFLIIGPLSLINFKVSGAFKEGD